MELTFDELKEYNYLEKLSSDRENNTLDKCYRENYTKNIYEILIKNPKFSKFDLTTLLSSVYADAVLLCADLNNYDHLNQPSEALNDLCEFVLHELSLIISMCGEDHTISLDIFNGLKVKLASMYQ